MSDKENNDIENEQENGEKEQEYDLDTLLGDALDESEEIAEMLKNSETLSSKPIDPGNSLDDFVEGDEETENAGENSETEEELKITSEKLDKIRKIKIVSFVSALTVFVLAAGAVAFYMVNNYFFNHVLSYEAQRVGADDFTLLMLMSGGSFADPAAGALHTVLETFTFEQLAEDYGAELSAEERQQTADMALDMKNNFTEEYPDIKNVTLEFIERLYSSYYLAYGVIDIIAGTLDLNAAEYAEAFDDYKENSKAEYIDAGFEYIVTETLQQAREAEAALENGELTFEEVLIEYHFTDYFAASYGFESLDEFLEAYDYTLDDLAADGTGIVNLDQLELSPENIEKLIALEIGESEIIELAEDTYVLLILDYIYIPDDEELKERYATDKAFDIFETDYARVYGEIEAAVKINQRVLDGIDIDSLLYGAY